MDGVGTCTDRRRIIDEGWTKQGIWNRNRKYKWKRFVGCEGVSEEMGPGGRVRKIEGGQVGWERSECTLRWAMCQTRKRNHSKFWICSFEFGLFSFEKKWTHPEMGNVLDRREEPLQLQLSFRFRSSFGFVVLNLNFSLLRKSKRSLRWAMCQTRKRNHFNFNWDFDLQFWNWTF